MTEHRPCPPVEFEPAPCAKCGALNETQAETLCEATQDETGEYTCPGEFQHGISVRPTAASVAAMDAWIEEVAGDIT